MFTSTASAVALSLSLQSFGFTSTSDGAANAEQSTASAHTAGLTAEQSALNYTFDPQPATNQPVLHLGARSDEPTSDAPNEITPPAPSFGAKDSWRINFHAHVGEDVQAEENWQYLAGVGFSYFVEDDLSLDFEFNGMFFDQEQEDGGGFNFNLLLRWHFLARENWSLYLDGGAGLLIGTSQVPDDGSNFNFTPQAGLGASFNVGDSNRLMLGARWHHISNANLFDDNPGRDSIVGYIALSMPF